MPFLIQTIIIAMIVLTTLNNKERKGYKMKCNICRKHDAVINDYRFIDSCGLQGKIATCEWCRDLSDVAVSNIIRDELDPKTFYNEEEK
jgi:hypothetical protein